MPCNCG